MFLQNKLFISNSSSPKDRSSMPLFVESCPRTLETKPALSFFNQLPAVTDNCSDSFNKQHHYKIKLLFHLQWDHDVVAFFYRVCYGISAESRQSSLAHSGCGAATAESHGPRCDSLSCKPEEQVPSQHNRFHAKWSTPPGPCCFWLPCSHVQQLFPKHHMLLSE